MKKSAANLDATIDMPSGSELEEVALIDDVAQVAAPAEGEEQKKRVTRRVGLVLGSSPSMSDESHERLRARLLLSALLLGSGLSVYLIFKLLSLFQTSTERSPAVFWTHVAVTISTLGIAWRLCVHCKSTLRHLRVVEFILFGGTALLFAIVSHAILADSIKAGAVTDITPPWLLLIFTYALLIPNTWQRAALVIIPIALIPIGLALSLIHI